MIKKITITDYPRLIEIWTSAVLNTHDFLTKDDFLYYRKQLPIYFEQISLFGFEQNGIITGFIGIAKQSIEMLFVDDFCRGTGIGKKLISHAITELQATKVDVNEQNVQAVGFYEHIGFKIVSRSKLDNEGKKYPILHMQLEIQ